MRLKSETHVYINPHRLLQDVKSYSMVVLTNANLIPSYRIESNKNATIFPLLKSQKLEMLQFCHH